MERLKQISLWFRHLPGTDKTILLICTALTFSSFGILVFASSGETVLVYSNETLIYKAPLNQDNLVELEGPLGTTLLKIENHSARIISSPCPNKTCIRMGKASHTRDVIACVPNQLIIRIEGSHREGKDYDLLSR